MHAVISTTRNTWRALNVAFFDVLFPPCCHFCDRFIEHADPFGLCDACVRNISVDAEAEYCPKCGILSLQRVLGLANCPECSKRNFRFDRTIPFGIFRRELRQALIRMKSPKEFALARSIGRLVATRICGELERPVDLAVSIPKHWWKRLVIGANSADFIATEIVRQLKIPYHPNGLRWRRSIRKQSLLSVTERARNVRGALKLARGFDVRGASVLVVDDTMTTGATVNEAARVLKRGGAAEVTVAVAARASNLDALDALDFERSVAPIAKPVE